MKKIVTFGLGLAAILVMTTPVALAQSKTFNASVLQAPTGLNVYQRYYHTGNSAINPSCEFNCPIKPCESADGQLFCQLTWLAKGSSGYRGYDEDLFNYGAAFGTVFHSVFDYEANPGAGNHQGFYAWVVGSVNDADTSLWNDLGCVGTQAFGCLGVANEANSREELTGVPASSGGPSIANVGGLSPIPVPKAAAGSSGDSFNLAWDAVSSVGKSSGLAPFGYELWGARSANCSSPATPSQFQFVKNVGGPTNTTVTLSEVPGSGNAVTFALKILYPSASATGVASRYLSANSQCFLGGGLSAEVYDLAANYAGQTNVEVRWKTSLEDGVRGFYVSRATTLDGQYTRVSNLIPAKGEASAYSFIDAIQKPAGAVRATGLYYKIESIDIDDNATAFGPVKANLPGPNRGAAIKGQVERP